MAEEGGHPITTGCNGCFASLWDANHELKHDDELRAAVNENLAEIDREFKGTIEVTHYVDALYNTAGLGRATQAERTAGISNVLYLEMVTRSSNCMSKKGRYLHD